MPHKAGYVNIIGNPNVGKSTLMNAMVGQKLAIITSKAQTTRHRIMGIVNGEDFQIIYSDTPGILKPHYLLHESMMKFVDTALQDADIFLFITDVNDNFEHVEVLEKLKKTDIPVIVLINKIDLSNQQFVNKKMEYWKSVLEKAEVMPISASYKFNLDKVFQKIIELLPDSPPYFPKDELTDKSERFFVSEIIREKILTTYQKEIPYSVEVVIDNFKELSTLTKISATIYVSRESQKSIIIGHEGKLLKKVGTEARKDIEAFIERKVFLELFVKLNKDWRNNPKLLKYFGYVQQNIS